MTTVRYTADGGHYRIGGHGFDPGDERDVDDELAEHLTDVDDFEVVDDAGEAAGQEDGPPAIGKWEHWNEDDWLDLDYKERKADVLEGRVDAHLDEIAAIETSDNVSEAVETRRDELED